MFVNFHISIWRICFIQIMYDFSDTKRIDASLFVCKRIVSVSNHQNKQNVIFV